MKKLLLITTLIFLIGCESEDYKPIEQVEKPRQNGEIKISRDLYYAPIGRDNDGCMMYQAKSDTMMTMQAIIYQNGRGKFSMGKDKLNCL